MTKISGQFLISGQF